MQKFVNDAVSTTEIIHCAFRMMVKTAFETHFSRVVKNPFVADMVLRVREGELISKALRRFFSNIGFFLYEMIE
jgi:hypothetical protein